MIKFELVNRFFFFLFVYLFSFTAGYCQLKQQIDSLRLKIIEERDIEKRALHYNALGKLYFQSGETSKRIDSYKSAEELYATLKSDSARALNLCFLGNALFDNSEIIKSTECFDKAQKIAQTNNNLKLEFQVLERRLDVFKYASSSSNNILLLLKFKEKVKQSNDKLLFDVLLSIINQYVYLAKYDEDLIDYSEELLKIATKFQDSSMLYTAYFYTALSNKNKVTIQSYKKALNYISKSGESKKAPIYNNLSGQYYSMGEFYVAMLYADSGYQIAKKYNLTEFMAASKWRLAFCNFRLNQNKELIGNAALALDLFKDGKVLRRQDDCAYLLSIGNERLGNYKKALEYLKLAIELKDSFRLTANINEVNQSKQQFEYELAFRQDSLKNLQERQLSQAKLESISSRLEKEQTKKVAFLVGFILMLGFVSFGIFAFRKIKKVNEKVKERNLLVEQKNKEITDSIQYAKRIQNSILPPTKIITDAFPDSFVLYLPKDIVAGDFYWIEKKGNKSFISVADCTGHGVPGAMVSVMCSTALTKTVMELDINSPNEILDKTNMLLEERFERSEEELQDGMDIALCKIENMVLEYAGANNSLYYIRNNELFELGADKQPIGKYINRKPFNNQKIELQKGDCIYLYTDGFADQFGGEKGKKFKYSRFKELLVSLHELPMETQKQKIESIFQDWKQELEQIDDVCILGIRI